MFYGTAIKYQGQFVLPVLCAWLVWVQRPVWPVWKKLMVVGATYGALMMAVTGVNKMLVPQSNESHSWQFVKFFDLTGISLSLNEPLYPSFITQRPQFDFEKIKQIFQPYAVDPLVFGEDPILIKGADDAQRQEVWNLWRDQVLAHPFLYLKTRLHLWMYNMTGKPFMGADSVRSTPVLNQWYEKVAFLEDTWVGSVVSWTMNLFRFVWMLPLFLLYGVLGWRYRKDLPSAQALWFTVLTALSLMVVLIPFSMAATPRYVYFSMVLFYMSHPLAWMTWKGRQGL
jgi:hypothetical protein